MSFEIRHTSPVSPSVVFDGTKFHMAIRALNNDILYTSSADGQNWGELENTRETTTGVPAVAFIDNRPVIVFPAADPPRKIRYTVRDDGTGMWIHSVELPDLISDDIVAAVGKTNAEVIVFFRAENSAQLRGVSFFVNKKACMTA